MSHDPNLRCVELCRYAVQHKRCFRHDCRYAHDLERLRPVPSKYRKKGDYPVPGGLPTENFFAMIGLYQEQDRKLPAYARQAIGLSRAGPTVPPKARPQQPPYPKHTVPLDENQRPTSTDTMPETIDSPSLIHLTPGSPKPASSKTDSIPRSVLPSPAQQASLPPKGPTTSNQPIADEHPPIPEPRTVEHPMPEDRADAELWKIDELELRVARLLGKEHDGTLCDALKKLTPKLRVQRLSNMAESYIQLWIDCSPDGATNNSESTIDRIGLLDKALSHWQRLQQHNGQLSPVSPTSSAGIDISYPGDEDVEARAKKRQRNSPSQAQDYTIRPATSGDLPDGEPPGPMEPIHNKIYEAKDCSHVSTRPRLL